MRLEAPQPPRPRDGSSPIPLISEGPLHNQYQNRKQQDGGADNPHDDHQLVTTQDLWSEDSRGHQCLGKEKSNDRASTFQRRAGSLTSSMPSSNSQAMEKTSKDCRKLGFVIEKDGTEDEE